MLMISDDPNTLDNLLDTASCSNVKKQFLFVFHNDSLFNLLSEGVAT